MSRKKKTVWIIIAIVVAVGLFYGGVAYGKAQASAAASAARGQFAGRTFGQGGNSTSTGGRGGARGAGGGAVIGTVLSTNQTGISIQLMGGGSQIIIVPDSTTVLKSVAGTKSDVMAGQSVVIQGTANSDGSFTAQSIQLRPGTTTPAQQ